MAYFPIKMIGWQELELSLIRDQISHKINAQLKYGGS